MASKKVSGTSSATPKKSVVESSSFSLEGWLKSKSDRLFWYVFAFSVMLTFGLFETKIGLVNDDALYIEGGVKYARDFFGYFFTANAPLYPMMLGLFIALFGSNLLVLKLLSTLFFFVSLYWVYKAFRSRIPYTVLFGSLIITATNAMFVMHASLTYTECFYAGIQALFLWIFLTLTDKVEDGNFGQHWKIWFIYGLTVLVMYMGRNVAVAVFFAVLVFFLIRKQWFNAVLSVVIPAVLVILWEFIKRLIWGDEVNQFGSQSKIMMRKELFNPADPNNTPATFWDFIVRFWENTEIYFSARFWELLGFRNENSKPDTALTLFTLLLMLPGFVYAIIRKNKAVLISVLYFGALCGVTFVALHTNWGQARLIMIYFPFIFFTIFYGFYELFQTKALKGFSFFFPVLLLIFILPNFFNALKRVPENIPVLSKNLSGDEFYGYTPDWINFFRASRYCARELPEGSYVASRRAPMSFIYGDFKEFYPVYSVPSDNADTLLARFKENKVTHVLLAELRINPKRYIPERYINTLHRFVAIIAVKYPQVFRLVHTEGKQEKSEIYEIRYEYAVQVNQPAPSVPSNVNPGDTEKK
jgi:hypothetical protein